MSSVRIVVGATAGLVSATAVGAIAAANAGVSWRAFAPNVAAVVLGALAFVIVSRLTVRPQHVVRTLAMVGLAAQAATLTAVGLEGVHRWLSAGPLMMHVSSMALPWWCALLLDDDKRWRARGMLVVLAVQALHVFQPDAAQGTALAVVVAGLRQPLWLLLVLVLGAAVAWGQPDPLLPVAHVEHIHELILSAGLVPFAVGAAGVLVVVPLCAATPAQRPLARAAALMLLTSWTLTFVVGAFPCAVFGAGAGAVFGVWGWWWLLHQRSAGERHAR